MAALVRAAAARRGRTEGWDIGKGGAGGWRNDGGAPPLCSIARQRARPAARRRVRKLAQSVEPGTPVFEGSPAPQSADHTARTLCASALPDSNCGQVAHRVDSV